MSMTRLKIIDGDSAEIVEQKVNHFIETYVYSVERILVYPKKDTDDEGSTVYKGYYAYITYRKKLSDEELRKRAEAN